MNDDVRLLFHELADLPRKSVSRSWPNDGSGLKFVNKLSPC